MALQTFTAGQVLTAAQVTALQTNDYNQTVSTKTANYTLVAADKGTRVVMNSASATTITVNTSLFSAGDTLFIQNIGAGVCTITAGTATVSTVDSLALGQYAGGTLYFTSTGVAVFFSYGLTSSTWTSWSPVLSDGWTNGTGTWAAYYTQIGKTVDVRGIFTTGNGTKGTTLTCTLPVTASSNISGPSPFGVVGMTIGGVIYAGRALHQSSTTFRIYAERSDGTYVSYAGLTSAIPAAWAASGDIIRFSLSYEAA